MKQMAIQWAIGGGGALVLSAAARALPEPTMQSRGLYRWLYSFTHLLLANFDKVGK